jgi:predicted dehydrogenase
MTKSGLKVAVIGYGYWGRNIARVVSQSNDFILHTICDSNAGARDKAARVHSHVNLCERVEDIPSEVEVVAVITPADSHFELAQRFLKQGKHVLLTKPFTRTHEEAVELVRLAKSVDRTVFVDHTFVFNPAVRKLKEMLPRIGKPFFVISQRMNLGLYQPDVNVIYDLMPHDLSIICYLFDAKVKSAQNFALSAAGLPREDMAHSAFQLDNGVHGMVTVSWLSPFKIRQFLVVGSEGMLSYDDVAVSEKIKFYDRGVSMADLVNANTAEAYTSRISYRSGDLYSPAVANFEALDFEMREFRRAISDAGVREQYNDLNLAVMHSLMQVSTQLKDF